MLFRSNGRPEAQSGYNDDLVMSFAISMFLRDTSLKFQQQSLDVARAAMNNMRANNMTYAAGGFNVGNYVPNPYQLPNKHGGKEDISWLI